MRRAGRNVSSRIGASRHRLRTATTCLLASGLLAGVIVPVEAADLPAQSAKQTLSGKEPPAKAAKKKKKKKKACPKAGAAKKKKKKKKKCPPPSKPTPPPTIPPLPPEPPPGFAPPLDPTVATSMVDATKFLYEGSNPVQEGVADGTIDEQQVAVLRGRVTSRNGAPLGGVTVTILDHPELGSTETRPDGLYDMAVNGGGDLTVSYVKSGYLPIERRVMTPWQDYQVVDEVAMIPLDSAATTIQSNAGGLQVHRSSVVTDQQGSRRTTMIFKPGTTATMTLANGSTQPLPGPWTVRATEYTVGDTARNAMPAELPPTSGFTFATELSIDEADAAGAVRVDLSNPVSVIVENFINAPVGMDMPSGYHHEEGDGRWTADPDGRVMKMVGVTGGMADLDIDGNDGGAPESPAELTALGIDAAERTQIASLYSTGQEFWRVPTPHFSELDHNVPPGLPAGAQPPPNSASTPSVEPTSECGSIISCEDQTLRERVGVNGTPFSLFYSSDRVPGRDAETILDVRVTGPTIPNGLKGIVVQANVAGHLGEQFYEAPPGDFDGVPEFEPNLHWEIPWDGTDIYGRTVQGKVPILVKVSYVYPAVRYPTAQESINSFGGYGTTSSPFPVLKDCIETPLGTHTSSTTPTPRAAGERAAGVVRMPLPPMAPQDSPWCGFVLSRSESRNVGAWDARGINAMGAWSLDAHHSYDHNSHTVYRGDGLREQADLQPSVATIKAGAGATNFPAANGGSAFAANIDQATDVATAPDGTLYILSFPTGGPASGGLRRVEPDGTIFEVANSTSIGLNLLFGTIVVDEDERVYVGGQDPSAATRGKVVRVDPDGSVTPIAGSDWTGTPTPDDLGDDGPATAAKLMRIFDLTMGTDGSLYVADDGLSGFPLLSRVRKIDPSTGLISSAAGGGSDATPDEDLGDGEDADEHSMAGIRGVAFGPDGVMYAAMSLHDTVVKVGIDGMLTRFAGTGTGGSPSVGLPALNSDLESPNDVGVSQDGTVYIRTRHLGSSASELILAVTDARVTIAGGHVTNTPAAPNGSSAPATTFVGDRGLAIAPDGTVYARDHRFLVRAIAPRFSGFGTGNQVIASEDGAELWVFDEEGRHLVTLDTVTGTILYSFNYDGSGRLIGVVDRDNRTTTIQRASDGRATAIVAPGGARTELDVNASGYATQIRDSAGVPTQLTYNSGGLLTQMIDRRGGNHTFTYDGNGRLTGDDGPGSRNLTFARDEQFDDSTVTMTTAAGRETTYRTRRLANFDIEQTTTEPTGAVTELIRKPNGTQILTTPDGTVTTTEFAPDPRFGLRVPFISKEVTTTPGGRTSTRTYTRTATLSNPADPFSFTTLTDTTNIDGHTETLTYTKSLRRFQNTSAVGRQTTTLLDSKDHVISETEGAGRTPLTTTYDASGHPTDWVQGSLHHVLTWDARDRLTSLTDAAGRGLGLAYDGADNVSAITDGEGGVTQLAHDGEGELTGVTEPNAHAHSLGLDGYGALTGYTPPGGGQQTVGRNNEGRASSFNQGAGHSYTIGRDAGGRVTSINASGADDSSFTYVGNTTRPATSNADRPGAADDQSLAIEWDTEVPTKLTYSGGARAAAGVITLTYNGRGFLTQRKLLSAPDPEVTTNLTYDNDDLLTGDGPYTFTRGGALGETTQVAAGAGPTALDRDIALDVIGRRTTVAATVGGASRFSQTHTYDNGSLLASRSENVDGSIQSPTFSYDDARRLTGVSNGGNSESYAYDSAGNRTSRSGPATSGSTETATYDAQGLLDTRGGIDYSFDAAGYLTQRGSDTFNYGPQGTLLGANVGGTAITYVYDGTGRRTSRTDSGGTEQYLYGSPMAPFQLTASRDSAGVLTQYFYDPDDGLIGIERGETRYYVFSDRVGSPRLVTDTSGATVKRINYDAFGNVTTDTAPGFALRVGFAGGLKDPTSGLVLMGNRDYEPASGRFTSRDPILFDGGQSNLYAYVGNDPVNNNDPDGLDWGWFDSAPENAEKISKKTAEKVAKDIAKNKTNLPKQGKPFNEWEKLHRDKAKNEESTGGLFSGIENLYKAACKALSGGD